MSWMDTMHVVTLSFLHWPRCNLLLTAEPDHKCGIAVGGVLSSKVETILALLYIGVRILIGIIFRVYLATTKLSSRGTLHKAVSRGAHTASQDRSRTPVPNSPAEETPTCALPFSGASSTALGAKIKGTPKRSRAALLNPGKFENRLLGPTHYSRRSFQQLISTTISHFRTIARAACDITAEELAGTQDKHARPDLFGAPGLCATTN
jgi:hypothetical protein